MKLLFAQGDIFQYASKNSEAAIVFGKTGLNELTITWSTFLNQLPKDHVLHKHQEPWKSMHSKYIDLPNFKIKHLYFLKNETNAESLSDIELSELLLQALTEANQQRIKKLSFNGARNNGHTKDSAQNRVIENERVKFIVDIIKNWANHNPNNNIEQVSMVSLSDSFTRNFPEN